MTTTQQRPARASTVHPLEPLSAEEITRAVGLLREAGHLGDACRFVSVVLHEPPKSAVLAFEADGTATAREAAAIVLDKADGKTYEAVASLSDGAVTHWEHVPGVQPQVLLEEFFECEAIVKADAGVQDALRKRGITEFDGVMVDPWSAGHYGDEEAGRLLRALVWVKMDGPDDNGYAHPVENLIVYVDTNARRVVKVEDHGVIAVPRQPGNYAPDAADVPAPRTDLKPISITQPEGTSFTVDGHEVRWQRWRFRVGFTPREGLVLNTVRYTDGDRERSVLYRASLSEMVVPYGDPAPTHRRKNAFDAGEYNIGTLANPLELGCDCLGEIYYFDGVVADGDGNPMTIPNAVCLHEEDYGLLWKHTDFRTEKTEVRRSRRLVISFIATVGNYEYGFFWYLYQDGTIQFEVKLTGIMSTGAVPEGTRPTHGQLLNSDGLYAPIHQHVFNMRLDLDVDGVANSIYEIDTETDPPGPQNPLGNAYRTRETLLDTELAAQRRMSLDRARCWKIVNPHERNAVGEPPGYALKPRDNVVPLVQPEASVMRRAGFMAHHLWVTPHAERERHAAGEYPNQHQGGEGLLRWTAADRPVADTDLVVWYTFGSHHVARLEDWPVMPAQYAGFSLQPTGFFDRNPALDAPRPMNGHCG
ncbi:primary-amine oxidase [Pseudonocardia asaccharolytica]|uniref:Amine oxidase n=1 Tax=Pseudonocardia asaccharolytica DSM 44247 = NBRC 16224 TaxID=1123024 RepID=A0A511CXV9_9PSEU|nr:primary-amine oxidase [Pseudonocardia asaccharolytica]GEL17405.1 amine oxidase [Pseudonocardia asaccharolytica DSM 44247 = NBRC 16224]